jgi:hypothetical protein
VKYFLSSADEFNRVPPESALSLELIIYSFCLGVSRFCGGESTSAYRTSRYLLNLQMFGSVGDVFISKRRHEIIAVVVVWLESHIDSVTVPRLFSSLDEVFWKELPLLVEVVPRALFHKLMLSSRNTSVPHVLRQ